MRLTQLLLPLYDNHGEQFPPEFFAEVRDALIEKFGGLTIYARAPAHGLWQQQDGETPVRDELVIFEVMSNRRNKSWWQRYRQQLEQRFKQQEILIRTYKVEVL